MTERMASREVRMAASARAASSGESCISRVLFNTEYFVNDNSPGLWPDPRPIGSTRDDRSRSCPGDCAATADRGGCRIGWGGAAIRLAHDSLAVGPLRDSRDGLLFRCRDLGRSGGRTVLAGADSGSAASRDHGIGYLGPVSPDTESALSLAWS